MEHGFKKHPVATERSFRPIGLNWNNPAAPLGVGITSRHLWPTTESRNTNILYTLFLCDVVGCLVQ